MLYALLFLAGSLLLGYTAVKLIGFCKTREEELFSSIALGLALSAHLTYALFYVFKASAPYAAIALEIALALAVLRFQKKPAKLAWDKEFWLRVAPALVIIAVLFQGSIHALPNGSYGMSSIFYGDAYYHISIEKYFAYNDIVPPQDPQYSGVPLNYPFMTDFYSGMLERLGMPFTLAFPLPALAMIIAFFALVYFFALRLGGSKNAAAIAVLLILFSGSFTYPMMLQDLSGHATTADWLQHPDRDYAIILDTPPPVNTLQFFKSQLVPQRSSDFGYPVAVIVFILLLEAVQTMGARAKERKPSRKTERGLKHLLFAAGILAGLLPLLRETSFLAVMVVAFFLALFYRRKEWFLFFAPAIGIALPQIVGWVGPATGSAYIAVELGWRSASQSLGGVTWFWLENIGIPAVFAVIGFFAVSKNVRKYYLAFMPVFILINVLRFSPDNMNNMKLLNMWQVPTLIISAIGIERLSQLGKKPEAKRICALAAAAILVISILPGILSVYYDASKPLETYTKNEIQFASAANEVIPQDAVVLAFDGPHVFDLVGRVRMLGFPAVGWVKGRTDWYNRVLDERDFYAGKRMKEVILKYGITHVALTPNEKRYEGLDETAMFSSGLLKKVYGANLGGEKYEVYEVDYSKVFHA